MAFSLKLTSLTLNDGGQVPVLPAGITAFVGPNNSGKSQILREIQHALLDNTPSVVTHEINFQREGSPEEVLEWFEAAFPRHLISGDEYFVGESTSIVVQHAAAWFAAGPPMVNSISHLLIRLLDAESRLTLSKPVDSFDVLAEPPSTALQRLFLSPKMEAAVSVAFSDAFGAGLVLNRMGGKSISLHVGESLNASITDPSEYLTQIAQRSPVATQGDGIRSYVGILLASLATPWPILLVDEPEAFLHPPQARALGRQLATIASGGAQVILATHSADIVRGLLDGPPDSVAINRLTRMRDTNHVASLPDAELQHLWEDPLLRFSNILDGLFHDAVVLCESDADCRFYEAVLAALQQADEVPRNDWLFVHCGGKHRMPVVVRALQAVGVPVRVIADIDVLRDTQLLNDLMTMLGLRAEMMTTQLTTIRSAVQGLAPQNPVGFVKDEIERVFDQHAGPNMTREVQNAIRSATRSADGWTAIKRGGAVAVPQGDPSTAAATVFLALKKIGIYVVPVGELERWDATVPGHGPGWTTEALTRRSHDQPGSPAWVFIKELAHSLD